MSDDKEKIYYFSNVDTINGAFLSFTVFKLFNLTPVTLQVQITFNDLHI